MQLNISRQRNTELLKIVNQVKHDLKAMQSMKRPNEKTRANPDVFCSSYPSTAAGSSPASQRYLHWGEHKDRHCQQPAPPKRSHEENVQYLREQLSISKQRNADLTKTVKEWQGSLKEMQVQQEFSGECSDLNHVSWNDIGREQRFWNHSAVNRQNCKQVR